LAAIRNEMGARRPWRPSRWPLQARTRRGRLLMGCTPLAAQDRRDYVDDDDVIVICKDRNIANSKIRIYEHARSCAAIVNTFLRQRWYFMELCQGRQRKDERRNDTIDFVSLSTS
jgi:hypothetical protein